MALVINWKRKRTIALSVEHALEEAIDLSSDGLRDDNGEVLRVVLLKDDAENSDSLSHKMQGDRYLAVWLLVVVSKMN